MIHSHKPIYIENLELSFPSKTCFEGFNTQVYYGSRIAIIGRNGSGKSTLLKMLYNQFEPTNGVINLPDDIIAGYLAQTIDDEPYQNLSGGQRLNKALTQLLNLSPNLLLLDEPTNHLDQHNRKSLMRMLRNYSGTLIIISHDRDLLRNNIDILWHIDNHKITIFSGNYDDYIDQIKLKKLSIESDLTRLKTQKKALHDKLMQEQHRAAQAKKHGKKMIEQRKWATINSPTKMGRNITTAVDRKKSIEQQKYDLTEQLANLRLPEIITPKFNINHNANIKNNLLLEIRQGSVSYQNKDNNKILSNINLILSSEERIAILGDNGSGKSTLIKAILSDNNILKQGDWLLPNIIDIGYLDQHYKTLDLNLTVFNIIKNLTPQWSDLEIRRHLNDFLFRNNTEVNILAKNLSGGEKARLSLAQIAAKPPKLLILDELTNNLDLETRSHVIEVLKYYPGSLIIIDHDSDFLAALNIDHSYLILNSELKSIYSKL